jgi:hypothetical protein
MQRAQRRGLKHMGSEGEREEDAAAQGARHVERRKAWRAEQM